MATEMYQHKAREIYARVREAQPNGTLPDAGVWPWFVDHDEQAWCVSNGATRFMICTARAQPYVAERFQQNGTWYSLHRYFEDGHCD